MKYPHYLSVAVIILLMTGPSAQQIISPENITTDKNSSVRNLAASGKDERILFTDLESVEINKSADQNGESNPFEIQIQSDQYPKNRNLLKPTSPGPNLTFWNVSFISLAVNLYMIEFWITNNGTSASGTAMVALYFSKDNIITTSDHFYGEILIPVLNPNQVVESMGTFSPDQYPDFSYAGLIIDYHNSVVEDNENDNIWCSPNFQVLPDLIASEVILLDETELEISYKVTVTNQGSTAATGGFKNRIYLSTDNNITDSDYLINDWNVTGNLAAGESKTSWDITSTVNGVPPGEYYLGVIADAKKEITESNENNNTGYDPDTKVTITDVGGGGGGGDTGTETILEVPMAGIAPVIDGDMDAVWKSVCSVPMEKPSLEDDTAPEDWLDTYSSFRMMYDDDYYYLFIQAHDDIINISNGSAWENDSFEIYFDGDNSKNDVADGYDNNDRQIRYVYGQTSENMGNAPHSNCKFLNTDNGYNFEVRIPAQDMTFEMVPDHTFGFDIQFNDNDTGGRDHQLRWWSTDNDAWDDASLFGTAKTTDYAAANPMYILQASEAPAIDGTADEAAWENIPWISSNTFIEKENGAPFNPLPDLSQANGWNDCRFNYKMMWHGNMLYFFANVFDDVIDISHPDWWMNDCMELQIDGNNDKGQSTDSNDHHYYFVYSETPASDAAFTRTTSGWTVEAGMDLVSDLGITPIVGHRIGLEVQFNDNDGGGRDLAGRWWSDDNITWTNPSYRGTAELTGTEVVIKTGVGAEGSGVQLPSSNGACSVLNFHLSQNYPNPFNPSTMIRYTVPKSCFVALSIYDLLGREIAILVNESKIPGEYSAVWNGQSHPSGIYICHLKAGEHAETRMLILQK
jgi:hypothetical protein